MKNKQCYSKFFTSIFLRRPGVALPMAMMVVVIGTGLVMVMFYATSNFSKLASTQRLIYMDQLNAVDYIEQAKGRISTKIVEDEEALHPKVGDEWNSRKVPIASLSDLQVYIDRQNPNSDPLNITKRPLKNGRSISLRVYDLTYEPTWITSDMSNSARMALPSPLIVMGKMTELKDDIVNVGDVNDPLISRTDDKSSVSQVNLKNIGAYLVRVEIFDQTGNRVRLTEEAFFQLTEDGVKELP